MDGWIPKRLDYKSTYGANSVTPTIVSLWCSGPSSCYISTIFVARGSSVRTPNILHAVNFSDGGQIYWLSFT